MRRVPGLVVMQVGIIGGSWSRSGCDACEDGEPGKVEGLPGHGSMLNMV